MGPGGRFRRSIRPLLGASTTLHHRSEPPPASQPALTGHWTFVAAVRQLKVACRDGHAGDGFVTTTAIPNIAPLAARLHEMSAHDGPQDLKTRLPALQKNITFSCCFCILVSIEWLLQIWMI